MALAPTESRIFADRYRREATRQERLHANHLASGTATWHDAMVSIEYRMGKAAGPIKRTALVTRASDYLRSTQKDGMHFMLGTYATKRTSLLSFASINFGRHPLQGVTEDGVSIMRHSVTCRRDGTGGTTANQSLGYVSRHAVQRLHERGRELTIDDATKIFTYTGMLGYMMGRSETHIDGGMALRIDDILAVGVVRFAMGSSSDSNYCIFFEVRTFLPADDIDNRPALLKQGDLAADALGRWMKNPHDRDATSKLVDGIPKMPWRDENDFIAKTAIRTTHERMA